MTVPVPRGLPTRPRSSIGGGSIRAASGLLADERVFVAAALLLTALPLLWPTVPPLVDLPNHMSRYRVGLDYASSPFFRQWFDFHWVLVGNLGVDLLVTALAPALGLEGATKLVVLAIPLTTVAGTALVARAVHGRVPATAALAFVCAYNWPLNYGFVNFALAAGLALNALALWIALARWPLRRAALFVPVGLVVWLAHAFGWGMLGVMVFGWELARERSAYAGWTRSIARAALASLPLVPPLVPMLHWFGGDPLNAQADWSLDPRRKLALLFLSLRNANAIADVGTVGVIWLLLALAIGRTDVRFDRRLIAVAGALLVTFLLMPPMLMGSFHADMRLAPYVVAMAALALRPVADTRATRAFAAAAGLLLAAHSAYQAVTFYKLDRLWTTQLAALPHLPVGTRVFGLVAADCPATWDGRRLDHLQRMAIVRRQAFANGTWPPPGQQTMFIRAGLPAAHDRSDDELILPAECHSAPSQALPAALRHLPRERFDYLWLVGLERRLWPTRSWLRPVWHGDHGILYRILPPGSRLRRAGPVARQLG